MNYSSSSVRRRPDDRDRRSKLDKDSEVRDRDGEKERDREPKDRDKDRDRDKHRDNDRKEKKHRHVRKRASTGAERTERRTGSDSSSIRSSDRRAVVPELDRRSLGSPASRYPSFSKQHSKEAVSRENISRQSPFTPEPTDLGTQLPDKRRNADVENAPPSPPLTTTDADLRRSRSGNSMRPGKDKADPVRTGSLSDLNPHRRKSRSLDRRRADVLDEASEITSWTYSSATETHRSPELERKELERKNETSEISSFSTATGATTARSMGASTTTELAPKASQPPAAPAAETTSRSSPVSASDSSPRTPTTTAFPPRKQKPAPVEVHPVPLSAGSSMANSPYQASYQQSRMPAPPPPPPPPPAIDTQHIPRVDYLLQHGGLPTPVPRSFLAVLAPPSPIHQYSTYASPRLSGPPPLRDARIVFSPLQSVLDNYMQVLARHGSLAVATGYKSVARRLLDRLERVFNRDIGSEKCDCVMCTLNPPPMSNEPDSISWGEILEFVSGRRELPPWPPFTISPDAPRLDAVEAPMQKLDIDVPEEYREHYIRQSRKTKDVVQAWLASQPELPSSPPQDVDNDTLVFAILTHLEPHNRRLFTALLRGNAALPPSRAPTPAVEKNPARPDTLSRTARALQRLYRLAQTPRDAECAIFLLKHPALHTVLATLAAISAAEWEILTSGRFDGFLWSGAETPSPAGAVPGSRTQSPFPATPSRGATPFGSATSLASGGVSPGGSAGAPVQIDEDTEIAVLGEVEREIYAGMEALEDAFEALHAKAEGVRAALRARSTGLAEWGDDGASEIRPDDSASNVSSARRRRRHGKERRTPAPVEEVDED
ncbi:hypothetical protein EJ06DRAFT_535439 [Trichodelitschia bisporula]|uniref:5-Methylcytosine G/T mismatch-specific DNA glycosylase n=1 Tax=Trichodelitschia bisporula TaxID=703511 RepID=A0A6G1IC23_9PEZI|nr:hypothetical protein EJ06DRAFT_535439 [Trichodelitschia bisporula]